MDPRYINRIRDDSVRISPADDNMLSTERFRRIRTGRVIYVNRVNKTVKIQWMDQAGETFEIPFHYSMVGATWGRMHSPKKNTIAIIGFMGENTPYILGFRPMDVASLNTIDEGEIYDRCEHGTSIHLKNKRIIRTTDGKWTNHDDWIKPRQRSAGWRSSDGSTTTTDSISASPGGIEIVVREPYSKFIKSSGDPGKGQYVKGTGYAEDGRLTEGPFFKEHSFLFMYDDGNIIIQSAVDDGDSVENLARITMEGSGKLIIEDAKSKNVIEMNPGTEDGNEPSFTILGNKSLNIRSNDSVNISAAKSVRIACDTGDISFIGNNFNNKTKNGSWFMNCKDGGIFCNDGNASIYSTKGARLLAKEDAWIIGEKYLEIKWGKNGVPGTALIQGVGDLTLNITGNVNSQVTGNMTSLVNGNLNITCTGLVNINGQMINLNCGAIDSGDILVA